MARLSGIPDNRLMELGLKGQNEYARVGRPGWIDRPAVANSYPHGV
jgi:hypothetical protein